MQYFNYHIPYHPFSRVSSDIHFLPVTNYSECKHLQKGDKINLFGHDVQGKISRIGSCQADGPLIKYSDISKEKQKFCTDTYCWQLPIKEIEARSYGMDTQLMQYAGLYIDIIPFKPRKIKQSFWDYDYYERLFYSKFWYIWRFCDDNVVREQYRRLVVHLHRDDMMSNYRDYKRFMNKYELKCKKCGITLNQESVGTNRFFEIHDTETDIMRPFKKLDKNKLIVVCPSCHVLLHNATIPQDVTKSEKWTEDFHYGMHSGWSE